MGRAMADDGREIELKFHCAPDDLAAVLAAAPAGDDEVRELISVYFDTPDRALERAGVSLRVRESGGRRIQTLKRGKGLTREEHEQPVEGFAPDPSAAPLREVLPPEAAAGLSPAFYVGVHRRQRLVRYGGAEIEIALDEGEVRAGGDKSPISEVELELKAGDPAALFELARELLQAAPLYLSFDGKASMGQQLTAGAKPGARKKEALALKPGATVAAAFQATARNALAHLAANGAVLRAGADGEAVHQLRVAARRLRSAMATFAPVVEDDRSQAVKAELKWVAGACDAARDLEVYVLGAKAARKRLAKPPPGLKALVARAEAERDAAAEGAREAVGSARFRRLLLEATAWVETGAWLADDGRRGLREAPATGFAAARLERQLARLEKRARGFAKADAEARHRVRIAGKTLRYGLETFASLYPTKRSQRFAHVLKDLQAELGALNDAAVAEALSARLAADPETAFAAGELAGLAAADAPGQVERAGKALKRLKGLEPFWR